MRQKDIRMRYAALMLALSKCRALSGCLSVYAMYGKSNVAGIVQNVNDEHVSFGPLKWCLIFQQQQQQKKKKKERRRRSTDT